jgi:hypothetical protein
LQAGLGEYQQLAFDRNLQSAQQRLHDFLFRPGELQFAGGKLRLQTGNDIGGLAGGITDGRPLIIFPALRETA